MLGGRKHKHIIHRDGFLGLVKSMQRSIETFLLNGSLGDGTRSAGFDVFGNIMSEIWPIKLLL